MLNHHPDNERIKHKYATWLRDAKRQSEDSIDAVLKALARFEEYTKYKDFKTFRHEQASGFKKQLSEQNSKLLGTKLSKSTLHSTFRHLKTFFEWLSREQGYKSHIRFADAEYFNTSSKDRQVATARREKKYPTLEQIKYVINQMPTNTEIEMRDRALIAFTILTGARDSAIASAKLKHINLERRSFFQDAREVDTKFSKTFTSFFFPVGDEIKQIVIEWIQYLIETKLWGNDAPLFPMTSIAMGSNKQFEVVGIKSAHWSTASPIRDIFKRAFASAGLPYFNPHSFRNTLTNLAQTRCKNPEVFKAWSQNLGHESVLTTLYSYGEVSLQRQAEILSQTPSTDSVLIDVNQDLVRKVFEALQPEVSRMFSSH